MSIFKFFNRQSRDKPDEKSRIQMITTWGEYYYAWNGKLYDSDIVRSCVRPFSQAVGKLVEKHIRDDPNTGIHKGDRPWLNALLQYPNPDMTGQQFREKMATQLMLNNNAFALLVRGDNGVLTGIYPIPAVAAEILRDKQGTAYIRFTYKNGKQATFYYSDVIHLKRDFSDDAVFGASPAEALSQLMECVGYVDQGLVKAIKNSGIIRWLLKFTQSMRPEDIKENTKNFVDTYLTYESDSFGAAGVDSKVDAKQIEPKDYVPNAALTNQLSRRIYSFFNTNEAIVQSTYNEDQWNAYYESVIEPVAIQFGEVMTMRLFTRREIAAGNKIVFESSNLACASMATKLNLVSLVDRGIMSPNEVRHVFNLAPIEGGDTYVRRLDTAPIDTQTEGGDDG